MGGAEGNKGTQRWGAGSAGLGCHQSHTGGVLCGRAVTVAGSEQQHCKQVGRQSEPASRQAGIQLLHPPLFVLLQFLEALDQLALSQLFLRRQAWPAASCCCCGI